ncbi:purine-nucleoside phosphorylase [Ruania albidiflava]|uniref:purine-nucleoside phosphorylase n=1 Tax=Ruania albidiflava TaxID=366586 RepID=UPI0003B6143B|nr:purine-nucleoside phosphorylase [Ruania albidiflava]
MTTQYTVEAARQAVAARTNMRPTLGVILGSGLDPVTNLLTDVASIPYAAIPGFASPSVERHAGELVVGTLEGTATVIMRGRLHYYEGLDLTQVTFPIFALRALGVQALVVTNACGAINTDYRPGEIMMISDHLNTTGVDPLRGPNDERWGPRFPETTGLYDHSLRQLARTAAARSGTALQEGVYAWWPGPSLETPAEIRMLRGFGADVVGMSTVPEALTAGYLGMRVLGLSCIGNMASGVGKDPITAEGVARVVAGASQSVAAVVRDVAASL